MIRGTLILITNDENGRHFYMSTEFNGGMDPEQLGGDIIKDFADENIRSKDDFFAYIDKLNKEHFHYKDEQLYDEITLEAVNGDCKRTDNLFKCSDCQYSWFEGVGNKTCNYSIDFHGVTNLYNLSSYSRHSDYYYWLNLSDEDVEVLASNGVVLIPANGGTAMFNFDDFSNNDEFTAKIIPFSNSKDFHEEAKFLNWMGSDSHEHLTKEEAEELAENTDFEQISCVFDSVSDFGRSELQDSIGVENWIIEYMDLERFGQDTIDGDDRCYILSSGRVVCKEN